MDEVILNGVRYVRADSIIHETQKVVESDDERLNMTQLARLWGRNRGRALRAVEWMRANEFEIGFKTGRDWIISKKKALKYQTDGTLESAIRERG